MGANEPKCVAYLEPRGHGCQIYIKNTVHCYILNIDAVGLVILASTFSPLV